jgi:hypothetical protein
MDHLLEDLALGAVQLARVLGQMAVVVPRDGPTTTGREVLVALQAGRVGYILRVLRVLELLTRAEGWLESIDHETGAHAILPGVAPGAPSIETQIGLRDAGDSSRSLDQSQRVASSQHRAGRHSSDELVSDAGKEPCGCAR